MNNDIEEFGNSASTEASIKSNQSVLVEEQVPQLCSRKGTDGKVETNLSQYAILNNREFRPTQKTRPILESGFYEIKYSSDIGIYYSRMDNNTDEILEFPDSILNNIVDEIQGFWDAGDKFREYGFLHSRGYMFYGPAGSGKTMLIKLLSQKIINNEGIIFKCGNPEMLITGLSKFREIEENRPIIVLFEDIDATIQHYGEEAILSYLDGEHKINNVLNIATTNYPEKLDKRIVARPRRFDRVIKIGMPNANVRREFFIKKLNLTSEEVEEWVESSDGFSFAALADMVISVKCLGNDLGKVVKNLRNLSENSPDSHEYYGKTFKGFS